MLASCGDWRGPTTCSSSKCVCASGYCTSDSGSCWANKGTFVADIVQVNSNSPTFPGKQGQIKNALTFSGGGSRSLALTMGALRALENLNLTSKVDAISSVSGGSWASSIYVFANESTTTLLGAPTDPTKLTMSVLNGNVPMMALGANYETVSRAQKLLLQGVSTAEVWVRLMATAILSPFGLDDLTKYMAPDQNTLNHILSLNPQLKASDFFVAQPGKPTLVMGGTLDCPKGYVPSSASAVNLQISPDYSGSPFYAALGDGSGVASYDKVGGDDTMMSNVLVGGGLVQSFAFGGSAPATTTAGTAVQVPAPIQPLSLAKAVAISSSAFGSGLTQAFNVNSYATLFTSELNADAEAAQPSLVYWPVSDGTKVQASALTSGLVYRTSDGQSSENTGLNAMLQRKAKNIVAFINTDTAMVAMSTTNFCTNFPPNPIGMATSSLLDKFGWAKNAPLKSPWLSNNQVFQKAALQPLLCTLQTLRAQGKPAVALTSLEVMPNSFWGITGGYNVTVLWFLNDVTQNFVDLLPSDTQAQIAKGDDGAFAKFPVYSTTNQNNGKFTFHTKAQINLLAAMGEYAVLQNAALFQQVLGGR